MQQHRENSFDLLSLLTGQNTPKSNLFCQENLTETDIFLENRDTYKLLSKMGIDKGKALGAMMLGALAVEPALAEDQRPSVQLAGYTNGQVTDCVAFVKDQRTLAAENGVVMSRGDQKGLLIDCQNGELEARIAEQERILASLDEEIRQLGLQLDDQARILDEQGREIARVVSINNQLILRRQSAEARTMAALDRIERYLLENS